MKQEILKHLCNIKTVTDGRGGIFTWIPDQAIVEFNMIYIQPGKIRGNHYHPEFTEYFLVVDGAGVMVGVNPETGEELITHMSKGMCIRNPVGLPHAFYAISLVTAIALLTKKWNDCKDPIIQMNVV